MNAVEKEHIERERAEESDEQVAVEQPEQLDSRDRKHSESEYESSEPLIFSTKKSGTPSIVSEPSTQIHTPSSETFTHKPVAHPPKPKQIRTHSTPPAQVLLKPHNLEHRRTSFEKHRKDRQEMNSMLLSEAEVLRRRRVEAVMGMGETRSANISSDEDDEKGD